MQLKLAFEAFGAADAPPLVILHGFFASSRNWRTVAQQLAQHYRVYVPDLRNHGASFHHPVMDYPSMMVDVLDFLNARQIATASVIGHSMGGKIAMWLALNHPASIDKLVVVDICPIRYPNSFNAIIKQLKSLPLNTLQSRQQAEAQLVNGIPELAERQFLLQNLVLEKSQYHWRIDLDIFANNADHIAAFPDTVGFEPYQGDSLFMIGQQSSYVKEKCFRPLFPKADFAVVAGAGHWPHVQQPTFFMQLTQEFLQPTENNQR
jgi:esterase